MLDDWSLNYDGNFILIGCICWYGWPVMAETVYTGGVCLVKCGRYLFYVILWSTFRFR